MNNDTAISVFIMVLAAIGIFLLIIFIPTSAGALECKSSTDSRSYWTYRIIDGKRCWYRGHKVLSKSQLRWSKKEIDPKLPSVAPAHRAQVKTVKPTDFNEIDALADKQSGPMIMFPELADKLDALKRWWDKRWEPSR